MTNDFLQSLRGEALPTSHRIAFNKLGDGRGEPYALYRKEWERRPKDRDPGRWPVHLDIEQHANCNARCIFCARQNNPAAKADGEMPLKTLEKILDEAKNYKGTDWFSTKSNFRGEATLCRTLPERHRMIKEAGAIDVGLNTNGEFPREMLAPLMEHTDMIAFSLDSITPNTHKANRVGLHYDVVFSNVHEAIRLRDDCGYKTKIRVSFVHNTTNDKELRAFVAYWEDHRADAVTINLAYNPMMEIGADSKRQKFLSPYVIEQPDEKDFLCAQPFVRLVIYAQGNVLPCCNCWVNQYPLGNINDDGASIYDMWHSEKLKRLRKAVDGHYKSMDLCRNCSVTQCKVTIRKDGLGSRSAGKSNEETKVE